MRPGKFVAEIAFTPGENSIKTVFTVQKHTDKFQKIIQCGASEKNLDIIAYASIMLVFCAYLLLLHYSYGHFFAFNEGDKGVMYQLVYNTAVHGDFFYSSINGGLIDFAGGQRYILILLLPFFSIYPHPITFSVISSFLLAIGALPVYWLASKAADSKKIGLLFVWVYFFYPSVSWLFLESVKEEILALPLLLFAFYYLYQKNYWPCVVFLILAALCKQNIPFVVMMFGVYAYLGNYDRKWVLSPIIIGSAILSVEVLVLKPYFIALSSDLYQSDLSNTFQSFTGGRYSHLGNSFSDIVSNSIRDPAIVLDTLFTADNCAYLILLLLPVCFISICEPKVLVIGLPVLLQNVLSSSVSQKMITWHYASVLVFVVLAGAILSFPHIYRRLSNGHKKVFVTILLIVSLFSFLAYGPAIETLHNTYNMKSSGDRAPVQFDYLGISLENKDRLHASLNEIPANASIMTTHNFGPYLYTHENVSYLDWSKKPFDENYDYYLLRIDVLREYSRFEVFQKILQRPDMQVKYYDGQYVILGTGQPTTDIRKDYLSKFGLFKIQRGVGRPYYDNSSGEYVFFSNKSTNTSGYLVYGPYLHLPPGNYTIEYIIKARNVTSPDERVATVDVYSTCIDGPTTSHISDARKEVYGRDLDSGNYTPIVLEISRDTYRPDCITEFRVFQTLHSDLYVREITLRRDGREEKRQTGLYPGVK